MDFTTGSDAETRYPTHDHFYPPEVVTERLRMVRTDGDEVPIEPLVDLFDEETTRYLRYDPLLHRKEALEFVEKMDRASEEGEYAGYAMYENDSSADGGFVGLAMLSVEWDRRVGKWGIVIRPEHRREGYSLERARAFARVLFEHMSVETIEIRCFAENEPAKSSIESYVDEFGGRYVGLLPNQVVTEGDVPMDAHLFVVERSEYLASDGRS